MGLEGGTIRWGISIPQYAVDGTFEPAALRSYLARAEALGCDRALSNVEQRGRPATAEPVETDGRLWKLEDR